MLRRYFADSNQILKQPRGEAPCTTRKSSSDRQYGVATSIALVVVSYMFYENFDTCWDLLEKSNLYLIYSFINCENEIHLNVFLFNFGTIIWTQLKQVFESIRELVDIAAAYNWKSRESKHRLGVNGVGIYNHDYSYGHKSPYNGCWPSGSPINLLYNDYNLEHQIHCQYYCLQSRHNYHPPIKGACSDIPCAVCYYWKKPDSKILGIWFNYTPYNSTIISKLILLFWEKWK